MLTSTKSWVIFSTLLFQCFIYFWQLYRTILKKDMLRHIFTFSLISLSFLGTSQEKPNVLLIMADDLNDYIGAFGGHPDV